MNPILRNVLAVIVGLFFGGQLNALLIKIGPSIISPPEGVDPTTMEGLTSMSLLQPEHFIFPFLAHALGTLVGAFIAAKFAANNKMKLGLLIGGLFLLGGLTMVYFVGGPIWFIALDLLVAYIPMAWLGAKFAGAE